MSAINRKTRQFTDLNLLFTSHPVTADVTKKIDEEAVKASVRNLVSTRHFDRPFHPEIGCQIYSLLFENYSPIVRRVMQKTIANVIHLYEPRVEVLDIIIKDRPDINDVTIDIIFKILNSDIPLTVRTSVSRVR